METLVAAVTLKRKKASTNASYMLVFVQDKEAHYLVILVLCKKANKRISWKYKLILL